MGGDRRGKHEGVWRKKRGRTFSRSGEVMGGTPGEGCVRCAYGLGVCGCGRTHEGGAVGDAACT